MNVLIFKTNIEEPLLARKVLDSLKAEFPLCQVNVDLHDCDKILRIVLPPACPPPLTLIRDILESQDIVFEELV